MKSLTLLMCLIFIFALIQLNNIPCHPKAVYILLFLPVLSHSPRVQHPHGIVVIYHVDFYVHRRFIVIPDILHHRSRFFRKIAYEFLVFKWQRQSKLCLVRYMYMFSRRYFLIFSFNIKMPFLYNSYYAFYQHTSNYTIKKGHFSRN